MAAERAGTSTGQPLEDALPVESVPARARHLGQLVALLVVLEADGAPLRAAAASAVLEFHPPEICDRRGRCGVDDDRPERRRWFVVVGIIKKHQLRLHIFKNAPRRFWAKHFHRRTVDSTSRVPDGIIAVGVDTR